jgi:uncharacterized protein DUF4760
MPNETIATVGQVQIPKIDPKLLGETYGFWCQTLVLFLAAVLAAIAIVSSRRIERKKSAIEAIFESKKDEELTRAIRLIAKLHAEDVNMATFARKEKIDSPESKSIRYALNHYESVSVAIFLGTYDEDTCKNIVFTTVTRLYERTKPYIVLIRKEPGGSPTNFQEFECLACRWNDDPLEKKEIRSIQA